MIGSTVTAYSHACRRLSLPLLPALLATHAIAADTNAPAPPTESAPAAAAAETAAAAPSSFWLKLAQKETAELIGYGVGALVVVVLIAKLIGSSLPKKGGKNQVDRLPSVPSGPSVTSANRNGKRPSACNVVSVLRGRRKLWRFAISGRGKTNLTQEHTELPEENMPAKVVAKGWRDIWKPRVNVAWLPSDKVFLRVAEFPASSHEELLSMVELQLEKLSPLPLTQIVWGIEPLPASGGSESMQSVVLIVVPRHEVESHLGQLESTGFMADRLELPEIHQLLAAHKPDDGIWFLPREGDAGASVLIAWWYQGTLKNLTIANLTDPDSWTTELGDQLSQVAWSGELEGWYSGEPHFHLLADMATADTWKPVLEKATGEPVTVDEPLAPNALAGIGAQRVASGDQSTDLLPTDIKDRYRQRWIDGIWMHGLGTAVMVYAFGVLLYFAALEGLKYQRNQLKAEIQQLSGPYNDALHAKARVGVLQEQVALKYATLEALRAVSAELPDGVVLRTFTFSKGKQIYLNGSFNAADAQDVHDFGGALEKLTVDGERLFKSVATPDLTENSPNRKSWTLTAELNSKEI